VRAGLAAGAWPARRQRFRALALEVSKIAQYAALSNYGVRTPRTLAAVGRGHIIEAAKNFAGAFITKHNRAGKGLGVRLFHDVGGFRTTSTATRSRIRWTA